MGIGERIGLFWKAFVNPEQAFSPDAGKKATMSDGLINSVLAFLIVPVIIVLLSLVGPGANVASGLLAAVAALAILIFLGFVLAALYRFVAGLLGGKGSLEKAYYSLSIFLAPVVYSYLVLSVLYVAVMAAVSSLPVLGIVLLPLFMVAAYTIIAYLFYVLGVAATNAQGISSLKGIFSVMASAGIIIAVLLVVLYAAFGSMALSALASGASTVPY